MKSLNCPKINLSNNQVPPIKMCIGNVSPPECSDIIPQTMQLIVDTNLNRNLSLVQAILVLKVYFRLEQADWDGDSKDPSPAIALPPPSPPRCMPLECQKFVLTFVPKEDYWQKTRLTRPTKHNLPLPDH